MTPVSKGTKMTDRTFTAAELREVLGGEGTAADKVQALHELILFPSRPTLADMTLDEQSECQWMQCDVGGEDDRAVIFNPHWEDGSARVLWPGGFSTYPGWERVTPRPDLPRMEWPGNQEADPALPVWGQLADHPKHGKVFVIDPTPDSDGCIRVMRPIPGRPEYAWFLCEPSELAYTYTDKDTQND